MNIIMLGDFLKLTFQLTFAMTDFVCMLKLLFTALTHSLSFITNNCSSTSTKTETFTSMSSCDCIDAAKSRAIGK